MGTLSSSPTISTTSICSKPVHNLLATFYVSMLIAESLALVRCPTGDMVCYKQNL